MKHSFLYGFLGVLFFVFQKDFWFWKNAALVKGVPIHLLYQILFCLVLSGVLFVATKKFWPRDIDSEG